MKPGTRAQAKRRRREAREEVQRQLVENQPDWKDDELAELRRIEASYDDVYDDFSEDWYDDWADDYIDDYEDLGQCHEDDYYWEQEWLYETPPTSNGELTRNLQVLESLWDRLTPHERIQVEWMVSKAGEIAETVLRRTG